MPRVRYVALVPVEFEQDVPGGDDFITGWGREHMRFTYKDIESAHPRREHPYEPILVEAVTVDDGVEVDLGELIAPGLTA